MNEIRLLQSLKHKQIIIYQNWYETKNHFWIIYEYLSGGDLTTLIVQDKGIPEAMLKVIAKMLIDGLQYIHSKNILYYNFKPSNFVFDEYNNLKFVDFSYARMQNEKEESNDSPLSYLSTELLTKTELPSIESDIWSLGVLLYELATGELPYTGKTANELMASIESTKKLMIPTFSIEFNTFINGVLRKEVDKRFTWSEINAHKWNSSGPVYQNQSFIQDSSKGKSVDINTGARRKSDNSIFESGVEGTSGLSKFGDNKFVKAHSNIQSPVDLKTSEKFTNTLKQSKADTYEKEFQSYTPSTTNYT